MGTAIVSVILAGVAVLIIRHMVKDKKAGKSLRCGENCSHCSCCGHRQ
ncbi:MAG: FeoB-associated Cys-rich membrane protein [Clostridiales bacterium]|nr:FeoB-associated Cys-rich membrane protein [Clostridiales bacterium]MDY3746604.1 FeoB-associated Cys-rich membrane protein [Lachnospiraceae bacterium]